MSTEEKKYIKGNMTVGSPAKCLLYFAIPMIIGNLFQQFYNIVDSIVVGKLVGADALAAVGASQALTGLFIMIAIGAGIGCSVVISQLFGAKMIEKMKTSISTALITILIFSIILSIIGRVFSAPVLHLMKTPADIFDQAKIYLDIYFYGFFFLFLYNAFTAVFNALGDSKKPLFFLIFSSCLNIALDVLFVGAFHWGVAGAAWATLIAQACSAVLSFVVLIYKLKNIPSGEFKYFDTELLVTMTKIAIPTMIQQSIISIGMIFIQACVNRFGSVYLAGYTAAIRIDGIAIVPMVNIGNAVATYIAQNVGARKFDRVKKGYHIGLMLSAGAGLILGILIQFFGPVLINMFMDANEAAASITVGVNYISIISIFYFIFGLMSCSGSLLRGSGDIRWFMGSTLINLVVRVIITYMFADITAGAIIVWANPIGWTISFLISFGRYKQGGWKNVKVIDVQED